MAKKIINILYNYDHRGLGYRDLQRKIGRPDNKSYDFCILVLRECGIISYMSKNRKRGQKTPLCLTQQCKDAYEANKGLLILPDLIRIKSYNKNKKLEEIKKERMMVYLWSITPDSSAKPSHCLFSTKIGSGLFISKDNKLDCKAIDENLGIPLLDMLTQRDVGDGGMFNCSSDFTKAEAEDYKFKLCNRKTPLRPIRNSGEIRNDDADLFLYDFINRCQSILFMTKYLIEYSVMHSVFQQPKLLLERDELKWYKKIFCVKQKENFIDRAEKNFTDLHRYDLNNEPEHIKAVYDRYFSENLPIIKLYKKTISKLLREINGKKYENTRNRYPQYVKSLLYIVRPPVICFGL